MWIVYRTRQYVAIAWTDALRLAGLDKTPIEDVLYASTFMPLI